ncbi:unnamed protein product [Choristocarpus tenellus]
MDDPSTWVPRKGLAKIFGKECGPPWTSVFTPRLLAAIDQLVGMGAWEEFGCGWWVVTFPGFAQPPWGAEGKWHVDGAHFRHYPHSKEIGLLPIFLFSDIRPGEGGTALLSGSHKAVGKLLWSRAGNTGLTGPQVSQASREALLPANHEDIVETIGSAGDVMLTHPFLLHARSKNLGIRGKESVRFMCHPAIPLGKHMDLGVRKMYECWVMPMPDAL